ncbi:hypothetical protein [Brevundimonas lenta]|uniref:TonB C-terminal domain-containing protein n=1 Tax=Brevundimonas lenta TaxID=424796 RepID=A0A7W6JCL4_9CAUL|nr:hypothetical protein [Brevundimonas lenta]MBB4081691.1 hypothetical protein [Brevundimonas lenta]
MFAMLFAGLLATTPASAPAPQAAAEPATATRGAAGVCIRWSRNRQSRVAEAVIAKSSGNADFDSMITRTIPSWDWPVGVDNYRGEWVGIWMALGGAQSPNEPLPDCSHLRDRAWAPAPAATTPAA